MEVYIKNVKISLYLKENLFAAEKSREKIFHHVQNLHITIYKHTPNLVNITSIKSLKNIDSCIKLVENYFNVKHARYEINCIMISFKASQTIKIRNIQNVLNMFSTDYRCEYNAELFSGAILKSKVRGLFPTIIIFHTGTFQIFGVQNLEYAFSLAQQLTDELLV